MKPVEMGKDLCIQDVMAVARHHAKVVFLDEYVNRVNACRAKVDYFCENQIPVYGLTTGLGDNWRKFVPDEARKQIQLNNIRAHSITVGEPINEESARALMFVMLAHLGNGHSGIRLETLELIRDMLNHDVTPYVPGHGSLGYLSLEGHIGMAMIGEGRA